MSTNPGTDNTTVSVGIDIGGTKVDIALVAPDGTVINSSNHATSPERGADAIITGIASAVQQCIRETGCTVDLIGVGFAGQVDKESGTVIASPNLGWCNVPLQNRLEEHLQLPVVVTNDVRAATWAEWKYGIGTGINDLICLFVGTGIGGGIVCGGQMIDGCNNSAGELGHATIVAGGRQCHCGNCGCLEAYAGGWAIAERAQEAIKNNPDNGHTLISIAGQLSDITAETMSIAYSQGDYFSDQIISETAYYLAAGITGFINILNPEMIILGGSVMLGLPEYTSRATELVQQNALPSALSKLRIVNASFGNRAGTIGAALLARHIAGFE